MTHIKAIPNEKDSRYEKKGECLRCGRCCDLNCPHLKFIVNEDLPKGTELRPIRDFGKDKKLTAVCEIFYSDKTWRHCTPRVRRNHPSLPSVRFPFCGFYFIDKKTGKRVNRNAYGVKE